MTRERTATEFDAEDPAFYEALGRAIKVARTQADVSRKALAERAGVSYAYLSDIETGRGRPSSKALLAIAHALGRSPSELLQEAELYGALQALGEPSEAVAASELSAEPRRWFHAEREAHAAPSAPMALQDPVVRVRKTELQRLARSRLAGQSSSAREELHAMIEGLLDEDVAMMLELARRLRRR